METKKRARETVPKRKCEVCNYRSDGLSMFRFPSDEARCKLWLDAVDIPSLHELGMKQLQYRFLCAIHFEEKYFSSSIRHRLSKFAIPSIGLHLNKQIIAELPEKRAKHNETEETIEVLGGTSPLTSTSTSYVEQTIEVLGDISLPLISTNASHMDDGKESTSPGSSYQNSNKNKVDFSEHSSDIMSLCQAPLSTIPQQVEDLSTDSSLDFSSKRLQLSANQHIPFETTVHSAGTNKFNISDAHASNIRPTIRSYDGRPYPIRAIPSEKVSSLPQMNSQFIQNTGFINKAGTNSPRLNPSHSVKPVLISTGFMNDTKSERERHLREFIEQEMVKKAFEQSRKIKLGTEVIRIAPSVAESPNSLPFIDDDDATLVSKYMQVDISTSAIQTSPSPTRQSREIPEAEKDEACRKKRRKQATKKSCVKCKSFVKEIERLKLKVHKLEQENEQLRKFVRKN